MENPSKQVAALLKTENRDLQFILGKVKILAELNTKLAPFLGALASDCYVANFEGSKLVLITASGAIATQIRFQTADLLRKLKSDPDKSLQKINDIQCKVNPAFAPPLPQKAELGKKMSPLSYETAEFMRQLAESLEDPALREIMGRIATRVKL